MAVLDPDSWLVAQPFTAAADSRRKRRTPEFSGVKDSPLFMVLPMLSLLVERPLSRVSAGLRISQIHEDPEITQAPPIFPGVPRRWHWCCKAVFRARRRAGWSAWGPGDRRGWNPQGRHHRSTLRFSEPRFSADGSSFSSRWFVLREGCYRGFTGGGLACSSPWGGPMLAPGALLSPPPTPPVG